MNARVRTRAAVVDTLGLGALRLHGATLRDLARRRVDRAGLGLADVVSQTGSSLAWPPDGVLLVDVAHALVPDDVLGRVLAAPDDALVVPVREVTDTLKAVDADGHVRGTVDRATRREVLTPVWVPAALTPLLDHEPVAGLAPGWQARLVEAAHARRAPVIAVPAPPDAVTVRSAADLALLGPHASGEAADEHEAAAP